MRNQTVPEAAERLLGFFQCPGTRGRLPWHCVGVAAALRGGGGGEGRGSGEGPEAEMQWNCSEITSAPTTDPGAQTCRRQLQQYFEDEAQTPGHRGA